MAVRLTGQRLGIALAVIGLGGGLMWWCNSRILPAPEAIQQALDDTIEGAANNDIDLIMDHISDDFRVEYGGSTLRRGDLKQRLVFLLRREIEVELISQDVEVFEASATVTIVVALWGGGLRGAASGDATAREIELDFELEDRDWMIVEARHRNAKLVDAL